MKRLVRYLAPLLLSAALSAQVYSPKLLAEGQPDSTNLTKFANSIYAQAHAVTPREKAEAIWRFFLTDGRYVKPGFWYHIAGWTYEEPYGEVLDPVKLLNSYGFGLCYHIAPLLEAVFKAGGFEDARCWFLTGHTVTEVFYDGAYHYFDSDMMGYNVTGEGSFRGKPVVSVQALERDPSIMLGKLQTPDKIKAGTVDYPWYPADVREKAIPDLIGLFTSTADNYLYPYTRNAAGHTMDFVLRPGEKLVRFFAPEEPELYYLPYRFDGQQWTEFPQEIAEYKIRTADGPRSQKDNRLWATGRIEYTPKQGLDQEVTIIKMPSPYVIIDARFKMIASLKSEDDTIRVETSVDEGRTWVLAGELSGPHEGEWSTEPHVIVKSQHGRLTVVSGTYGYEVKITKSPSALVERGSLKLLSRIQLNPRSLPSLNPGDNSFVYSAGDAIQRVDIPAPLGQPASRNLDLVTENGQSLLRPLPGSPGEADYVLEADGRSLTGFDAGARFLDLAGGLAPDKLTAETRHTSAITSKGEASIVWSVSPGGPFETLWKYPSKLTWRDGNPVDRLLLWPEAFEQVRNLPGGVKRVYVKLRTSGPALDRIRLAVYAAGPPASGQLKITQVWRESGNRREHVEQVDASAKERRFHVHAGSDVQNEAVIFSVE
jgi:hypothetical protein